jgi:hypothetical protein
VRHPGSSLLRTHLPGGPCTCIDGWVFVGYIDEDSEERGASYPCRRCAASPR